LQQCKKGDQTQKDGGCHVDRDNDNIGSDNDDIDPNNDVTDTVCVIFRQDSCESSTE
jgi:hypothetical protein